MVYIVFPFSVFKKERGLITSSTYSRYRQTPLQLKRVKAHASRREPFTFVLLLEILAISEYKNKKQTLLPYVLCSHYVIRIAVLWVQLLLFGFIQILLNLLLERD